jgi:hypothetical protein
MCLSDFVGFLVGDQDIGPDPNRFNQGLTGPTGYWQVDDIQESATRLFDAGAEMQQPVRDVNGGKLIASAKDAGGNSNGLIQSPLSLAGYELSAIRQRQSAAGYQLAAVTASRSMAARVGVA